MHESRLEYLSHHRSARAWAALDRATNDKMQVTYDPCMIERDSLNGKHVVVIGSGVGGLATAYELLAHNSDVEVTVLEARDRTGGRCLTLRTGDTLTEDKNSDLYSSPGETQAVRFERPVGDSEPYLNAGPGRIPSSHKRLLDYLRRFGVAVEIYVMASESNMSQMKGGPQGDKAVVNRQLTHNTRGWIAQMVYQNAEQLLGDSAKDKNRVEQLKSLMVTFGDLTTKGHYVVGTAEPGQDDKLDVSNRLQSPGDGSGFSAEFKQALHAVYHTQAKTVETKRFLACTTKVGWQADRILWQGKPFHTHPDSKGVSVTCCDPSEIGVVPIYGGISWTDDPITQIWYPSNAYHDRKGGLTGAHNFSENAARAGRKPVEERLRDARAGAALFDQ